MPPAGPTLGSDLMPLTGAQKKEKIGCGDTEKSVGGEGVDG